MGVLFSTLPVTVWTRGFIEYIIYNLEMKYYPRIIWITLPFFYKHRLSDSFVTILLSSIAVLHLFVGGRGLLSSKILKIMRAPPIIFWF